jgi:P27 family predicted phage terminase small subunit
MPAGRKPKPTAVKDLAGNPGKRKLNKCEPQFSDELVCPSWLTSSAKREWARIVRELKALNMLQAVDRGALAAYCLSYARWRSAEETVSREGQTVREPIASKDGTILGYKTKRHPATNIAKDERSAMLRAASLFGFDPSSRSRLVVGESQTEDPFEAFIRGMGATDQVADDTEQVEQSGEVHQ